MLNSRKKARVVVGVVFLLLLIVGSSAGYFLSQQSQDIRQQAMGGEDDTAYPIITSEPEEELIETEYQDRDTCKLRCDGVCEGSTCITQVIETDVTIEDFEEIEEDDEEKEPECTDSWCRGSNLENLEDSVQEEIEDTEFYDDNYITMNDYYICVEKNSPSECRAILNHIGDEKEVKPSVYDLCIASGRTGIECEYGANNPNDDEITTTAFLPDYLIPPEFDLEDNLSLTQDPIMRATLEAGYLGALSDCENNNVGFDAEVCKHSLTTSLQEATETGNAGIVLEILENPGMSVEEAQDSYYSGTTKEEIAEGIAYSAYNTWVEIYGEEVANQYLMAITNQNGYGYEPSSFLGIEGLGDFGNYISECQEGDIECLRASASFGGPAVAVGGIVSGGLSAAGISVVPYLYPAIEVTDYGISGVACTSGDLVACAGLGAEALLPVVAKPLTELAGSAFRRVGNHLDDVMGLASLKNLPGADDLAGWGLEGGFGTGSVENYRRYMVREIVLNNRADMGFPGSNAILTNSVSIINQSTVYNGNSFLTVDDPVFNQLVEDLTQRVNSPNSQVNIVEISSAMYERNQPIYSQVGGDPWELSTNSLIQRAGERDGVYGTSIIGDFFSVQPNCVGNVCYENAIAVHTTAASLGNRNTALLGWKTDSSLTGHEVVVEFLPDGVNTVAYPWDDVLTSLSEEIPSVNSFRVADPTWGKSFDSLEEYAFSLQEAGYSNIEWDIERLVVPKLD